MENDSVSRYITSFMDMLWPPRKRYPFFKWAERYLREIDCEFRSDPEMGSKFWGKSLLANCLNGDSLSSSDSLLVRSFQVYCFLLDGVEIDRENIGWNSIEDNFIKEIHIWWTNVAKHYSSMVCRGGIFFDDMNGVIGWPRSDVFCYAAKLQGIQFQRFRDKYYIRGVTMGALRNRMKYSDIPVFLKKIEDIRRIYKDIDVGRGL